MKNVLLVNAVINWQGSYSFGLFQFHDFPWFFPWPFQVPGYHFRKLSKLSFFLGYFFFNLLRLTDTNAGFHQESCRHPCFGTCSSHSNKRNFHDCLQNEIIKHSWFSRYFMICTNPDGEYGYSHNSPPRDAHLSHKKRHAKEPLFIFDFQREQFQLLIEQ